MNASILASPHEAILGHGPDDDLAAFFATFGFEVTARAELDAQAAKTLYGLDAPTREQRLEIPGAQSGHLRLVETRHPTLERNPFEPRALAVDLYTRDIDRSIEMAVAAGGKPYDLVEYEVGPLGVREIEIVGPGGVILVFLEVTQRRKSILDSRPDLLHSEVHSIVWSVPTAAEALEDFGQRGGLDVLVDSEIRGDTISKLMNLPKDDVAVRFTLLCDSDTTPARLEIIEFLDDGAEQSAPWIPLRPGILGPAFMVSDIDQAVAALSGSAAGEVVAIDNQVHGRARAVAMEGPGGMRYELWESRS